MIYLIKDVEELEEMINKQQLVLLLVYDSRMPQGRYASSLADDIAFALEPVIKVVKADTSCVKGLADKLGINHFDPRFQLYYNGRKIWEQIGLFMNYGSDKYAIRRGILRALRNHGLTPRGLGINLRKI